MAIQPYDPAPYPATDPKTAEMVMASGLGAEEVNRIDATMSAKGWLGRQLVVWAAKTMIETHLLDGTCPGANKALQYIVDKWGGKSS
jgi:hypothetical protein